MADPTMVAIDDDELRFAQLACVRLVHRVQGALSIGLPALITGGPEPRGFLEDRFRELAAFALVLHTISGRSESVNDVLRLREKSRDVSAALEALHRQLLAYLGSPERPPGVLRSARASASALCDAIAEYARLIELDRAPVAKVKTVVLQVFDALDGLNAPQVHSAG
jgi:hypothetical protein